MFQCRGGALVHADQQAAALLARIGEALQVGEHAHLALPALQLGDRLGDEVVVLHRRHRQVDPGHQPDLLGPESGGVDNMLGDDRALLGHHVPAALGPRVQLDHPVAQDDVGAAFLGGPGIGVGGAVGIEVSLIRVVEAADHVRQVGDRVEVADLVRCQQSGLLHAHGLEDRPGGFQPLPALRLRGDADPAGHVHADGLAALRLDLLVELDRVGLQGGDVRIRVQRVEAGGRVPGGAGGQLGALDQRDVGPAELGEVVEHAGTDHAAADDHRAILGLHGAPSRTGCRPGKANRAGSSLPRQKCPDRARGSPPRTG
jgi:hypothetical protein